MTRYRFLLAATLVTCGVWSPANASVFRDLLSFSEPQPALFEGDGISTTVTSYARYTNTSALTLAIFGIDDALIRDPEQVGVPDISVSVSGLPQIEAQFPTYDLFNAYVFNAVDPPQKDWDSVAFDFSQPFPITVAPGQSFDYVRVATHTGGGSSFGPATYSFLRANGFSEQDLGNRVGEHLAALDLDWAVVPEPSALLLAALGCLTIATSLRRAAAL